MDLLRHRTSSFLEILVYFIMTFHENQGGFMIIWNKNKTIKVDDMEKRYYYMLLCEIWMPSVFSIIGLVFECLCLWDNCWLYDFDKKGIGILIILCLIWVITVAFLFCIVQYNRGKTVGVDIIDLMTSELDKSLIWTGAFIIAIKPFIYAWSYINEKNWILFFLVIEGILSLSLICTFIMLITNKKEISRLVQKEIKHSSDKGVTKEGSKRFYPSLLQMAKMINYQDNEECDELIECITQFIGSIGDIQIYVQDPEYEKQNRDKFLIQIVTLEKLMANLYMATKGGKLLQQIMQQCVRRLCENKVGYMKVYLLVRGLLVRNVYALEPKEIIKIIHVMPEDADLVIDCIVCYFQRLADKTTEKVWADMMKKEFGSNINTKRQQTGNVNYIEDVRYGCIENKNEEK